MCSQRLVVLGCFLALVCLASGPLPSDAQRPEAQNAHTLPAVLQASTVGAVDVVDSLGDKLPHKDALKRFGTVRFRSGDGILSLAYSPDGRYLASGSRNDVVRLWDATSGQLVRTFKEHWVWALAFSPDGKHLATGGANKLVRLWEVESGKEVHQMRGHKATIKSLAFSKDSGALVSGSDDHSVRLWKVSDGSQVAVYQGHTFGVNAVAIAPDMKSLASVSTDRTIRLWNGKPKPVMHAPSAIQAISYLPDRKTLITGGDDGFIRVWDINTAMQTREWKGHSTTITHLSLSADGKTLVTAGADKMLRVWDVVQGTELRTMERRLGDCDALAMTPDGKFVAAGGFNNTIQRWDATSGNALANPPGLPGAISAMACSADGSLIAAAFTTNQVQLIDYAGKEKHRLVCNGEDAEMLLAVAPDGKQLATVSLPDTIILWDTASGKEKHRLTLQERDEVRCLGYSPDGQRLAIGYTNGGLRIWDPSAGKVVKQIATPRDARAVAYSRDGKTLAVGSVDAIVLYNADTYQPVRQYAKLNDTVACLAFAPDGRHLAAGMFANNIRLFDLTQPKEKTDIEPRALEGHQGVVYGICWSTNGRCLVSAGFDKTVRLWEFVNGQQIAKWTGHDGEVSAVAFHPLGRKVVSASRDTTLLIWDATTMGLDGKLPNIQGLNVQEMDQFWKELASDNNPQGNKALWTMVAGQRDSVKYLSNKVFLADPKKIQQCILDLNSDKFKDRETATATLASYERWVEGVLRKTLENPASEEVRQRVEKLLARLVGKDAISLQQERSRVRRIIEILEQSATDDARKLLQDLARGAAEEDLRDMAQAAVDRLAKR
jgi:WD40 repeat protein